MNKYIQFKGFKWYYIRGLVNVSALALGGVLYVLFIKQFLNALLLELGG